MKDSIELNDINHLKEIIKDIPNDYTLAFEWDDVISKEPNVMVHVAWMNIWIQPWAWDLVKRNIWELKQFLVEIENDDFDYWLHWDTYIYIDDENKKVIFT